jgi:hypothetical protein
MPRRRQLLDQPRLQTQKITKVVPGHNGAAGVGLADDPPSSVALSL